MNVRRNAGLLALGLMTLGAVAARAAADFTLSLDYPTQIVGYSNSNWDNTVVTFTGTITNNSTASENIYLASDLVDSLAGTSWFAYVTSNTTPSPALPASGTLLAPTASWSGTLFNLTLGALSSE